MKKKDLAAIKALSVEDLEKKLGDLKEDLTIPCVLRPFVRKSPLL